MSKKLDQVPGFSSEKKAFSLADEEVRTTLPYSGRDSFPVKLTFVAERPRPRVAYQEVLMAAETSG